MSKRTFTEEQIKELLQNPNVISCSNKSISFSKDFKIKAIKKNQEGLLPIIIFKQAGFNVDIIGRENPQKCLHRWRNIFRDKGVKGLLARVYSKDNKRKRPKINHLNEKEKIKYLEAKVAYLKAENDFLVKLRKKSLN